MRLGELLTCTCGDIHFGRVEPLSPRHDDASWPMPPVQTPLNLVALQLKQSARASALYTLPFGFNPGEAAGTIGEREIGV